MLPPLVALTCTVSSCRLLRGKAHDQPAAIAVVDGRVTVRLAIGEL